MGAAGRCFSGASSRSDRAAEATTICANFSVAAPLSSAACSFGAGGGQVGREVAEHQHLGSERQRHFMQARLARIATQVAHRLQHLQRIAHLGAEDLVHVGDQGRGAQPGAGGHRDDALGQLLRKGRRRQRRRCRTSRPWTSPCRPAASFLERMLAVMSGTLSTVAVTSRGVEAFVGRREVGCLADDGAA